LSRRALLEQAKAQAAELVLERISVGGEYEGKVSSLQKYGAFIELGGGVEGLVHISELTHGRVDRVEDVLAVGDSVTVKVLAVEPQDKSPIPKLRLSVRALSAAPEQPRVAPDEVLEGTVSKTGSFGVFVDTPKGSGLVPLRELGIPRGSDHRKAFPVGASVKVVLVHRDGGGKTTFSVSRVASVEEAANYREFTKGTKQSAQPTAAMGSLGALLAKKLSLPEPVAPPTPPSVPQREATSGSASGTTSSPSPAPAPKAAPKDDIVFKDAMAGRGIPSEPSPSSEPRPLPDGVFKRNR
jgi:small subunit ribosomal protein S1